MPKLRDAKIEVVIDNDHYEFSIADEMLIDRDDLDTELARQAAHYAWFSVLHERARMNRLKLEAEVDEKEKDLFLLYRERSSEKLTVDGIKAKVRIDDSLKELIERYHEAEYAERLLWSFVNALAQRKDALIALARARYHEMSAPSADEVERIKRNLLGR